LDFNPSSANLAKVYLISDQSDLTSNLSGYFVEIGNTADEVSLYRQDGTTEVKIIDGLDKTLNTSSVNVKIKVTRDDAGHWQLFSDVGASGNYTVEGIVADTTYIISNYFGVQCQYTSTRSTAFHFDDFVVSGDPFQDVTAPALTNVNVFSNTELELFFSEKISNENAQNINNYIVNNGVGNPSSSILSTDQKTIHLTFAKSFPNGDSCIINVHGVTDLAGNEMLNTKQSFLFFQPMPINFRDISITELLPDPDPQVKLPAAEFVEIYNRSENAVNLGDWIITDGSSVGHLASYILAPSEYLILTSTNNASLFSSYGKVMGVTNFPTLNNAGDIIVVRNKNSITIDSINYTTAWYGDADKKEGGWSLEKIDLNNICAEVDNWTASTDLSGGTPGKQNAVYANKPDFTAPMLLYAYAESPTSVILKFSEKLDKVVPALNTITLQPDVAFNTIAFIDGSLTMLKINLSESLKLKTSYTITTSRVYDCAGNAIQTDHSSATFGLPEQADSLDIVINEVLFNPKPTGIDFVEIYNKSAKYINLENWSLANVEDHVATNLKPVTTSVLQLKPYSYLVFTGDKKILMSEFPQAREEFIVETLLPSMNDDEGSITIVSDSTKMIDAFSYSDKMHSPFIQDDEGISLERIAFNANTNDWANWKSASAASGFATPGYINSNSLPATAMPDEAVKIEPEIFIPSYGNPNFAEIKYSFDKGGYIANVKIYDLEGREMKQLVSNESLSTQGFYRWDGDLNNGTKASVGYYVVRFEVFDEAGSVKTFHKRVIVATRF
ncbi:MAG TPA: lamin tail domain-containing protein, partial [Cyclobacteriaceae bacterium]